LFGSGKGDSMTPTQYIRAYRADGGSKDGPIPFVASTEVPARDGMIIEADGWMLENFSRNNLVLWCHDYFGGRPPIGKAEASIDTQAKQLKALVTFDMGDPFAAEIARKYREGFLNAVSVGFDIQEMTIPTTTAELSEPRRVSKAELLEISAVPIPADPKALMERQQRGIDADLRDLAPYLRNLLSREHPGPIPANASVPKDAEDAEWDAGKELAAVSTKAPSLRVMHAWVDPDGDPDAKSSYKFLHHRADGSVVWKGVEAAMTRLLHSSADIPDTDRRGIFNHLAAHYRQFDKEPPEFRGIASADAEVIWPGTALQMARLYLDMTDDADDDERVKRYRVLERRYRLLGKEAPEFLARAQLCLLDEETIRGLFLAGEGDLLGWGAWNATEQRTGAVLNARMRSDVRQIIDIANGMLARSEKEESEEAARAFLNDLMPRHDVSDWLTQLAG
jgi:HK97 family phage prohead protease